IVLSFEDGILNMKVFMVKPPKEIKLEEPEYNWELNGRNGLRMRSNSDSYYVIVSCNGKDLSSYSDTGIVLMNGVITIEPARLKELLQEGRNDMTFSFGDGETSAVINMTVPEKIITADKKEFSIRPSYKNDTVIHTNSDASSVMMNVNGRDLNSENTDGLSVSSGTVTISSDLLLSLLNQGENLITFEFTDGAITIKASLFEDSYQPTSKQGTEESSNDESSDESSDSKTSESSQESKTSSKTESSAAESKSESSEAVSSDAESRNESTENISEDEVKDKTSANEKKVSENSNNLGIFIVIFLVVAAIGAAVIVFIVLNKKKGKAD
ncbi:MAG: FeoB-associated Cys-rich membrane protein, partial [Clostridia bacterium]|nr:FeoB-associated Cys-rich membrane protein [Clostridia bacterium]